MAVVTTPFGITLDLGDEWSVADGCTDTVVREMGCIYLRHLHHDAQVYVGAYEREVPPPIAEALLAMLRAQQWASPPFDEQHRVIGALHLAAGSFRMRDEGQVVREYFVTDGLRIADMSVPGSATVVVAVRPCVDRLAQSLRFASGPEAERR